MYDTSDLRRKILEDFDALRAGKITPADARARALLARSAVDTMKVEIAAAAMRLDRFNPVILDNKAQLQVAA